MELSFVEWFKIVMVCVSVVSTIFGIIFYFFKREKVASENALRLELERDTTEKFKIMVERQFAITEKISDIDHKYSQAILELSLGSKETSRRIESIESTVKEMKSEVTEVDRKIDILIARNNP